ncbi:hypothetical protein BJ508DRAFT_379964 [Ascobolus immersus RN42]|uniref:Uncharacterized protein n=1 Tax=Ascobolus immersus RN42 TaxID=1160509 RepID=A0A3N4I0Z8_ASCIM|nr:hypothetical protein BJ508DRAFT_379964 [Ascobolus immersus RN42]
MSPSGGVNQVKHHIKLHPPNNIVKHLTNSPRQTHLTNTPLFSIHSLDPNTKESQPPMLPSSSKHLGAGAHRNAPKTHGPPTRNRTVEGPKPTKSAVGPAPKSKAEGKYASSAHFVNPKADPQPALEELPKDHVEMIAYMVTTLWPSTPPVIAVHTEANDNRSPFYTPILRLTTKNGDIYEFKRPEEAPSPSLRQIFSDGRRPGRWVEGAKRTPEMLKAHIKRTFANEEAEMRILQEQRKRERAQKPTLPVMLEWMAKELQPQQYDHAAGFWFKMDNPRLVTEEKRKAFKEKWEAHAMACRFEPETRRCHPLSGFIRC